MDKVLKDRAYDIALYSKYEGYQRGLVSMVINFFHKKTGSGAIATTKVGAVVNE